MRMHPLKRFIDSKDLSIRQFLEDYHLDFSQTFMRDVMNGVRNLSKPSVRILSQATGIPEEELMFPEKTH